MYKNKTRNNLIIVFFWIIPLVIQIFLSLVYTYHAVKDYHDYIGIITKDTLMNPLIPLNSAFTYWIGGLNSSYVKNIFIYIMFLGAIIPVLGFILLKKENKTNKNNSYLKIFFISGAFSFIPFFVNFISILCFIPAITPDSVYDIYYDVIKRDFLSDLFYSNPFIYEMIYICLIFLLCGLLGMLSYNCYKVFNEFWLAYFIPELLLFIIHVINIHYSFSINISPLIYCSAAVTTFKNIKQYCIEIGVLLIFTIATFIINKKRSISNK